MRVTIVVNNLSGGGAEKVAVDLANYLNLNHSVNVLTLSNKDDKFILDDNINRFSILLNRKSKNPAIALKNNINRLNLLKKSILETEPEVVITFMNRTNIRVLLSLMLKKIPVVITEHNYPGMNKMNIYWEFLRRVTYKKAYKLISVSKGISDWFDFIPEEKKCVIYNPITDFLEENIERKNIIYAMGRLEKVKGFDLLIKSFSKISGKYPEWKLNILGDGSQRDYLEKLIKKLNLDNQINLLGFSKEPYKELVNGKIFVLSSRNEGFGNVLLEAMKCGLAVISTDCPVGPKEIITHKSNGLLVESESVDSISDSLAFLIENEDIRDKLIKNSQNTIEKFSRKETFLQWELLLKSIS